MKLPCEDAIWYVLPQIRADLAKELVKKGVAQKDIADLLDITPSAVSQYINKKRAGKVKMPANYPKMIAEEAAELKDSEDTTQVMKLLCKCCMASRVKSV